MNSRALTLALLIAAIATYLIYSYVEDIEITAANRYGQSVQVLKAKKDINESETLTELSVGLESIPKKFLEPGAIAFEGEPTEDTIKSLKAINGTVALVPIKKGEQIGYTKITEPGIRTGLAPQVAPGRRAIAINVSEATAVSKLIKPGDRVDVIVVFDAGGGKENKISKTILQDVVILSTGRNITNNIARIIENDGSKERIKNLNEDASYSTVTVEADPLQAQQLALLLSGDSQLVLTLRNNDDTERPLGVSGTTIRDVLGSDYSRVQRAPAQGSGR